MLSNEYQLLRRWLDHPQLDTDLRQELHKIEHNKHEIVERFYQTLRFGTGGLRGIIGAGTNRMNIYTIRKTTRGLADYLQTKRNKAIDEQAPKVVIAYDCRHQSSTFAAEAAKTLAAAGVQAYVYRNLRPTPQLSFTVRDLQADAGIMITASHNPPEYNGYKVYGADGAQLNIADTEQLVACIDHIDDPLAVPVLSTEEARAQGWLRELGEDSDQRYVHYVASLVRHPDVIREQADACRIVFTPLHGTATKPVQRVLEQAGFTQVETVREQADPDPDFSTVVSPNPEEAAAFERAIAQAKRTKADVIFGTDPDADRMGMVVPDANGEYHVLTGNQTGALLLDYVLSQKQASGDIGDTDVLCKTIVTSELGKAVADFYGIQTINTLTGFKFIGEKMRQFEQSGNGRFVFGYEESYGYLIGDHVRDKDAIQAVLIGAEMTAYYKSKGMSVLDALDALYKRHGYFREQLISITRTGKAGMEQIGAFMTALRQQPPMALASKQVHVVEDYEARTARHVCDGTEQAIELPRSNVLKFLLEDDSWFCARPSGTEPKLKLYVGVCAPTATEADNALENCVEALEALVAERMPS